MSQVWANQTRDKNIPSPMLLMLEVILLVTSFGQNGGLNQDQYIIILPVFQSANHIHYLWSVMFKPIVMRNTTIEYIKMNDLTSPSSDTVENSHPSSGSHFIILLYSH